MSKINHFKNISKCLVMNPSRPQPNFSDYYKRIIFCTFQSGKC